MRKKLSYTSMSQAFDEAERASRDVARTLAAPYWNGFKRAAETHPEIFACPAGCRHIRGVSADVVVSHVARRHGWEPDQIVQWLEAGP